MQEFQRTELLIGKEAVEKLNKSKVAIFGIGGVGSYVVESLARSGIGNFVLVDKDVVDVTNINRQIIATHKTIGRPKVEVAKERILDINPMAKVEVHQEFFMPDNTSIINNSLDYVVDSVDTITAKLAIIEQCKKQGIPVISCMGTGNKLDPTRFEVADIYDTSICPLAKVMRKELRSRNIDSLKVVYSKEEPIETRVFDENGKQVPASISFVPSSAGLILAKEVVKDLI
jgi:tRNA A37 threonylcarbamoyladenosine dehydratase